VDHATDNPGADSKGNPGWADMTVEERTSWARERVRKSPIKPDPDIMRTLRNAFNVGYLIPTQRRSEVGE